MASLMEKYKSAFTGLGASSADQVPAKTNEFADLHSGAAELENRSKKLSSIGKKVAAIGGVAMVVAVACLIVGALIEPSTAISKIHIPAQIQQLYDSATASTAKVHEVTSTGGGHKMSALSDTLADSSGFLSGTLGRAIAGLMIMFGIVSGVIRQSVMSLFTGIASGVMLYNIPIILEGLANPNSPEAESEKGSIVEVKSHDLAGMRYTVLANALSKISTISAGERAYVLGQAAIKDSVLAPDQVTQAAAFVREGGATFQIPASIAYAIEMQAGGELRNPKAVELRDSREKTSRKLTATGHGIFQLGSVGFVASAFFAFIAHFLRKRVRRIKEMLGQLG